VERLEEEEVEVKLLVFDIESNNLLLDASVIHCVVATDPSTGETHRFRPHEIVKAYRHLQTADRLVAHNGVMYDCPVLERLVGVPNSLGKLPKCLDTLLISRLLWPDSKGEHPAGGHSLEKWAEFFGMKKLHTDIKDWSSFRPEMMDRCSSDVEANVLLYNYLLPRLNGLQEAVSLEHRVAEIICKQIQNGFPVDMEKVVALHRELSTRLAELNDQFSHIPPWVEEEEQKTPQYWEDPLTGVKYETKGEVKGKGSGAIKDRLVRGPNKIKRTEILFNPNSGSHKARLFVEKYNWEPDPKKIGAPNKWFPKGVPSTEGKVLEGLDYPEAVTFTKIAKVSKLMGTYPGAWIEHERSGRIHGDVITNGAVTGRMTHNTPNLNVPSIKEDKQGNIRYGESGGWGYECRDCFTHREGWTLVGCDASGLEARMLAHYVAIWDGGDFARMVLDAGDGGIHSVNQKLANLETRSEAKTFYFKFVYGGRTDPKLEKKLYAACPALRDLKEWCISEAETKGMVRGLDNRPLPIRKRPLYGSERTRDEKRARMWGVSVNTLLQSAGAVVMKKALCIFYDKMVQEFGPHGERWGLCANVHDEQQWECEPSIAEQSGRLFVDSIRESGEHFRLNIRLDGEYKVGGSWALTH
jgi:DNA polymerase I-like protein with 3'-5' exonuclease and polymerase domains